MKMLLDAKANVNALSGRGLTALMIASHDGHLNAVETLVEARAELNMVSEKTRTALQYACQTPKSHPIVAALIAAGAVIDAPGTSQSDISVAITSNSLESLKLLIAAGADLNGGADPFTPLVCAVVTGNIEALKILIDAGADVNYVREPRTALIAAFYYGYIEMVKLLIAAGADASVLTPEGHSLLHSMVAVCRNDGVWGTKESIEDLNFDPAMIARMRKPRCDYPGTLRVLVEAKADPAARGPTGETALLVAAERRNVEAVRALLAVGADPNVAANDGESPLVAAASTGCLACVTALLEAGADVNHIFDEDTAVDRAESRKQDKMASVLRKAGGKKWPQCMGEKYPLVHAYFVKDLDLFCKRVKEGSDDEKEACLKIALLEGSLPSVKYLLVAGVNPDVTYHRTPMLASACRMGLIDIVKELIDAGADLAGKDGYGRTAFELAAEMHHREIVTLLLDKWNEFKNADK
jgi:ankyrin repeat protein